MRPDGGTRLRTENDDLLVERGHWWHSGLRRQLWHQQAASDRHICAQLPVPITATNQEEVL